LSKEKRRRAVAAPVGRGGAVSPVSAGEEIAHESEGFFTEWHREE
jgi:hypothetical protein